MARKKQQQAATDHVGVDEAVPAGHALTVQEDKLAHIGEQYSDERDRVNQLIGQAQAFGAMGKFADVVSLAKLAYIKEHKLYKALSGKRCVTTEGKTADVGTWAGFLEALGMSRTSVDERLDNLAAFGEDALNNLTLIGAGYRELRQYRKLPEDQKTALIEIAKSGDKDSFLDLAEEIMARSAKKDELAADLQANYDAQSEVLENKNRIIDDQHKTLNKLKRRVETAAPDEVASDLRKEASEHAFTAESAILGSLRPAFAALTGHDSLYGDSHEEFMVGLLAQIERAVATLRGEFNLKLIADGNPLPQWLRPDADAVVDAELAKINVPDFVK